MLVHRVRARVNDAVVVPSWAYGWRRRARIDGAVCGLDARSPVGKRAGAPWWALVRKAGGLTENLLCGQMPPKDATFPLEGNPSSTRRRCPPFSSRT